MSERSGEGLSTETLYRRAKASYLAARSDPGRGDLERFRRLRQHLGL